MDLIPTLLPFLKGAVGWSAASFIYESIIKPKASTRRLAHVLAEEMSQNLQLLVGQRALFQLQPNTLSADLKLTDVVFKSMLGRIGELPDDMTGQLLLFYSRLDHINGVTKELGVAVDRQKAIKQNPDANGGMSALEDTNEFLRRGFITYRDAFQVCIDQAAVLLPKLRVAETRFGRFGYFFRKKPKLDVAATREDVASHVSKFKQ
jgi:hypothetical protein